MLYASNKGQACSVYHNLSRIYNNSLRSDRSSRLRSVKAIKIDVDMQGGKSIIFKQVHCLKLQFSVKKK